MSQPNVSRPSPGAAVAPSDPRQEAVVPTLRVMRLQSPDLHTPTAGCLDGQPLLNNALCLPDSLEVLVGETFRAYLGVLNVSRSISIRRLSVTAHLQTPSQRWQLPSSLEGPGVDVPGGSGVDAIVSHAIEEAGQHILRVEVSYAGEGGTMKTFRKFYRFQVINPLSISELTMRAGDSTCFVSISVQYTQNSANVSPIVIAEADFSPAEGLEARKLGPMVAKESSKVSAKSALALLDDSGFMLTGSITRYLFEIKASSKESMLRGIGAGDALGKAVFTWRKSMGETGRIASSPILCPTIPTQILSDPTKFCVHRSGLTVDIASAAAVAGRNPQARSQSNFVMQLPVTVEPIDPPSRMQLNTPLPVQFLVVNHSAKEMSLQLQFRLNNMNELAICGPSFVSLGSIPAHGGSTVQVLRFLPLTTGLLRVQGCWVVDLASDQEIQQPCLFQVFVEPKQP